MPGVVIANQPGVYLVDADGNVISAADGDTISNHEGLLVAGKDGTAVRFLRAASDGTLRIDPTGATTQPISAATLPLPAGAATEAKLEAIRALLATIDADTSNLDVALSTRASESKLEAVRVLLASLDSKDFATQTTLAAILVDTGQIEALLTTIDADTSNLDVALSTRATESTLVAADAKLGTIDSVLDSIKDVDGIKKITDQLPAGVNVIGEVGLDLPKLSHQVPDPDSFDLGERGHPHVDFKDRLITKSQVSSDEGAYRDDFTSALESSITGTLTFAASKIVTGSGTAFTTELDLDSVIRLTSDAQNVAVKVAKIFSDTLLHLEEAYTGTPGTGAGTEAHWKLDPGAGMTISQAASSMTIATGTTASSESHVSRIFEGPGDVAAMLSVSQRIANQELQLGLVGKGSQSEALFIFDGTLNNKIKVRATSPGGTSDTTTYTLPVGETTDDPHEYKVEVAHEFVRFYVDSVLAGEKKFHNPGPYEIMGAGVHAVNTGTPSSSTDLVVDALFVAQKTVIEVKVSGALDNMRTDSAGNLQVNIAVSSQALPLLVNPNFEETDGAIVAQQYKRVLEYTVPDDYDGWLIRYSSFQNETAKSRLVAVLDMGTYDFTPETFTPNESYVAPQWSAVVEAEVTTQTDSAGPGTVIVTVTYTNETGTAGRTGTFSIPKSSIVGSRFRLMLQTGDAGVRSIQAISDDGTGVGVISLIGFIQLAYHNDLSSSIQLETNYQPGAIAFPTGTVLAVEYQGGTVSKDRLFDMLIQLVAVVPD